NQGAGIAITDLNANGKPDLIVFTIDNPPGQNRGIYRVGHDLDEQGNITGEWGPWLDIPDWFSWENQGAGIAITDLNANGKPDLIVFTIDNPPGQNQALYRFAFDVGPTGVPAQGENGWSTWLGVPNWFSWENEGAASAVAEIGGAPQLLVVMVDAPPGQNAGFSTVLPLRDDPAVRGSWQVLPFNSQVLAIHAALLHTGQVVFFSGSGNSQVRAASPDWGSMAKGVWTSVIWDPAAPLGGNFFHPETRFGPDGKPFDFFCGGDTLLADGSLLSAGGNLVYPGDGHGNVGRADCLALDPVTRQWQPRARMAHGRWYPTLLTLDDGKVLAVSGLNETDGTLNRTIELYDPVVDSWRQLPLPGEDQLTGMPLYAHLFLTTGGRVFFSGGRMDDESPQGPCLLDLGTQPMGVTPVPGLQDPASRNQSASVLLPPAQEQKVMLIAGGPEDVSNATGSTAIADLSVPNPQYRPAAQISLPRMHLNAVLLPDRTVFVSGGALKRESHTVPRLQSEIYDPATDTWRIGATATIPRLYHSVALLLPDGRVVTTCGNPPPYGAQVHWEDSPNEELRLEVYSPPYLFAGPRPVITEAAEEWAYGQEVTVSTPQAGQILWASLIRGGSTTHAFDNSQRLVDLPITRQGNGQIDLAVTKDPDIAPPGWYMLFLTDDNKVPSTAHWIHL
ncbi:galactose oxidase-like domain-containing protein, partial [Streptomyces sp. NPDC058614]|uniref:galactose oxidase-like domain-containing protein n=1 Tax=Streptomyces sp. NPDC058614 TaxID=3346557 RepID=UPI00364AF86D